MEKYIGSKKGNDALSVLGYTDHSETHTSKVAMVVSQLLKNLGYSKREIELAKIAGYMYDIGNSVNRCDHAHSGVIMAFQILRDMKMNPADIAVIVSAIGNHDESSGRAINPVSATIIIADKTDVRRNRIRNKAKATFDMYDTVNYAVVESNVEVNKEKGVICLVRF